MTSGFGWRSFSSVESKSLWEFLLLFQHLFDFRKVVPLYLDILHSFSKISSPSLFLIISNKMTMGLLLEDRLTPRFTKATAGTKMNVWKTEVPRLWQCDPGWVVELLSSQSVASLKLNARVTFGSTFMRALFSKKNMKNWKLRSVKVSYLLSIKINVQSCKFSNFITSEKVSRNQVHVYFDSTSTTAYSTGNRPSSLEHRSKCYGKTKKYTWVLDSSLSECLNNFAMN